MYIHLLSSPNGSRAKGALARRQTQEHPPRVRIVDLVDDPSRERQPFDIGLDGVDGLHLRGCKVNPIRPPERIGLDSKLCGVHRWVLCALVRLRWVFGEIGSVQEAV